MSSLPRHLRGSRNVIRLFVLAVAVGMIIWLQKLDLDPLAGDFDEAGSVGPKAPVAAARGAAPVRTKVKPGLFRLQIVLLEQLLYKGESKWDDGWAVEVRARSLADSLLEYRRDEDRTRAGLAVARFAAMVGSAMDAPYNRGPQWPVWRKQWEGIRTEFFAPADWYQNRDPDGIPLSSPAGPVPAADRATARELDDFAVDLQVVIGRGLDSAMGIPEPPNAVVRNTDDGRGLAKRWRDWVSRWDQEMDFLARRRNATVSPTVDQHIALAGQELGSALNALRLAGLAAGQLGYPSKQARRERFDSAQARVQRARYHLSRVGTSAN